MQFTRQHTLNFSRDCSLQFVAPVDIVRPSLCSVLLFPRWHVLPAAFLTNPHTGIQLNVKWRFVIHGQFCCPSTVCYCVKIRTVFVSCNNVRMLYLLILLEILYMMCWNDNLCAIKKLNVLQFHLVCGCFVTFPENRDVVYIQSSVLMLLYIAMLSGIRCIWSSVNVNRS